MIVKYKCDPGKRKQEITQLLNELKVGIEFTETNKFKVFGKYEIFGEIIYSGHVALRKFNSILNRYTHIHTCAGIKAVASYMKQHAL